VGWRSAAEENHERGGHQGKEGRGGVWGGEGRKTVTPVSSAASGYNVRDGGWGVDEAARKWPSTRI